jgi:3-oxoacyl-[acyl-carrier protein] reductase
VGFLDGKVILVSGGAGDIGGAVVERCRAEGAVAVAADLAGPVVLDVRSSESWTEAVETVAREHGGIDGLVNAAGILRDALFDNVTDEEWDLTLAVNLSGTMRGCRAAALYLRERRGRIVNISSVASMGNRGQATYSSTKGAVDSLTKTLGLELGRDGVLVNAVAPWFVTGKMADSVPEKLKERALRASPIGRFAEPADIAAVVAFLLGPDSAYVNGQVLTVCGGASVGF